MHEMAIAVELMDQLTSVAAANGLARVEEIVVAAGGMRGIVPEALAHIFERFYRGVEARARPGIGLGLPIAKALVEAQNGSIAVESQIERGSVITVTLPRAAQK